MVSRGFPWIAIALLSFLSGCGSPFLVMPGGKLDGTPTEVPTDWAFAEGVKTVQLESNPADPYSVNIWAVGMGPGIYIHAGANRSTWVENIEADPAVRLRIDGLLFDLQATRVTDQAEFDRLSVIYEEKYGNAPRNPDVGEAYLFRLEAP